MVTPELILTSDHSMFQHGLDISLVEVLQGPKPKKRDWHDGLLNEKLLFSVTSRFFIDLEQLARMRTAT